MKGALFAVVLVATSFGSAASARAAPAYKPPYDPAFEQKIQAEIQARDPEGAALFAQATQARDRGDDDATYADLLEKVHARDPWFSHATRRLCTIESQRSHHERALALCREAYAAEPSPENADALATTLLAADKGGADNGTRALELAKQAAQQAPGDFFAQFTLCQAALKMNDTHAFGTAAAALRRIAPHDAFALFFSALDDGMQGRPDDALRELDEAHAAGLPDEPYARFHDAIEQSRSPVDRWGPLVLKGFVGWLALFALLLGLGGVLSAATLQAASRGRAEASGRAAGGDALLRRTYRVVLALTCAYYYASLPFVALSVVGLGAGLLYVCLVIGTIPIKLLLIAGVIVLASLWAMAKSLFVRVRDEDPGERLDLTQHPKLRAVLDEVAARIGTRPVDAVYVTPGTQVAVLERGGLLRQMRGKSERCLVLGAAVLDGMRLRELKAVLAHEYGHFQNEDTAGGGFALAVRRSLFTFAMHLARGGAASNLNPAWWFVRGFNRVFHGVSQGATRLQEILADRWAAFAYGSEAFARGLSHVVSRSVRFDAHLAATLQEVVPAKQAVANFYAFVPKKDVEPKKLEDAVEQAMSRPASPYDSHPRPVDRIAWVTGIGAEGAPSAEDDALEAWSILTDREGIEKRMSDELRSRLAMKGIRVHASA
jgi:Zn-dependent protease with chaperone function